MNFAIIEKYLVPVANKLSQQRYLKAIRDAFMSLIPITLAGGIAAVLSAAPATEGTTNGFMLAWKAFAEQHGWMLGWINTVTLGFMALYICIGMTYYLARHYKEDTYRPILLAVLGFFMLGMNPLEIGWASKSVEISFLDGKGLIAAIIISITTVELYHLMRKKNFGRIKLPDSVPQSLSETFASLIPGLVIISVFSIAFGIFNALNTTMAQFIYQIIAPSFKATDSIFFTIFITILIHIFWFFGIHDAALAGVLGPIRDGNLSINAAAHAAGESLPHIFTTPFWTYFVIIGGCGSVLALALLMLLSKNKQIKTVGRVGIIPAFFGISEPIIFGTPLMLNPIFFIPFVGASVVNGIISFLMMQANLIGRTFAMLSWQMPSPFGALLSTVDIKAFILIIILIGVDMLIYFPFLKVYERQLQKSENDNTEE